MASTHLRLIYLACISPKHTSYSLPGPMSKPIKRPNSIRSPVKVVDGGLATAGLIIRNAQHGQATIS